MTSLSYLDYTSCSKNNYDVYYQEKYNDKRETEFSAPGIFIIMKDQLNMLSLLNYLKKLDHNPRLYDTDRMLRAEIQPYIMRLRAVYSVVYGAVFLRPVCGPYTALYRSTWVFSIMATISNSGS